VNGSLPLVVETALYRAAQEGLNNVARHAQASQAEVTLQQSRELIACAVRDDGNGFDPAVVSSNQGRRGLGLVEIRERMAALGGTLRLVPRSERGTEFIVEIPLEASSWA
jgi:signal transduction histidine kinase